MRAWAAFEKRANGDAFRRPYPRSEEIECFWWAEVPSTPGLPRLQATVEGTPPPQLKPPARLIFQRIFHNRPVTPTLPSARRPSLSSPSGDRSTRLERRLLDLVRNESGLCRAACAGPGKESRARRPAQPSTGEKSCFRFLVKRPARRKSAGRTILSDPAVQLLTKMIQAWETEAEAGLHRNFMTPGRPEFADDGWPRRTGSGQPAPYRMREMPLKNTFF